MNEVIDYKRRYRELNVLRWLMLKQLKDINNWFLADFKTRGIIPSVYSCQRCASMIVNEEEVEIIVGKSPLCHACLGNITITKQMVEDYIKQNNLE